MDTLNLISIQEAADTNIHATGARLTVCIKGQSFFTGEEAFKKAIEVANCVAELQKCGLSRDHIQLLNVSTEVESGMFTRSSKANYNLLVNCESIEQLGRVLAIISSQENSKIISISWQYTGLEQIKHDLLQIAVGNVKNVAQSIANSLSVKLLGVHRLSYKVSGLDTQVRLPRDRESSDEMMRRSSRYNSEALDNMNLSHSCIIVLTVNAEFIVDKF
jgi:uncharacterized protein YggE